MHNHLSIALSHPWSPVTMMRTAVRQSNRVVGALSASTRIASVRALLLLFHLHSQEIRRPKGPLAPQSMDALSSLKFSMTIGAREMTTATRRKTLFCPIRLTFFPTTDPSRVPCCTECRLKTDKRLRRGQGQLYRSFLHPRTAYPRCFGRSQLG